MTEGYDASKVKDMSDTALYMEYHGRLLCPFPRLIAMRMIGSSEVLVSGEEYLRLVAKEKKYQEYYREVDREYFKRFLNPSTSTSDKIPVTDPNASSID